MTEATTFPVEPGTANGTAQHQIKSSSEADVMHFGYPSRASDRFSLVEATMAS
jgi:hypothetical protein